jgi:hypothetical protein
VEADDPRAGQLARERPESCCGAGSLAIERGAPKSRTRYGSPGSCLFPFRVGCRRSSAATPYGESAPTFAVFSHAAIAAAFWPAQKSAMPRWRSATLLAGCAAARLLIVASPFRLQPAKAEPIRASSEW